MVTDGAQHVQVRRHHRRQQDRDELNAALEAAYYPKDLMTTPYNPIVVNTGGKLVVIDTGTGEAASSAARAQPASSRPI